MARKPKRLKRMVATATAGYEGRFEIAHRSVDDPYERGSSIVVAFNRRHDVLTHWHARHTIDDAQCAAGRKFQAIWHRAEVGGPGAIDYGKPRVDGGAPGDVFTDTMIAANQELGALGLVIGRMDLNLMCDVIGQGIPVENTGAARGLIGKEPGAYVARRVRDALSVLALHWGTTGRATGRILGCRQPVDNFKEPEEVS
jgi:hypothetical protein